MFKTRIKIEKKSYINGIQTSTILKTIYQVQYKIVKAFRKEGNKIEKARRQLRNNAILAKSRKNPMKTFDVKIVINRKNYLKRSTRGAFRKKMN